MTRGMTQRKMRYDLVVRKGLGNKRTSAENSQKRQTTMPLTQ